MRRILDLSRWALTGRWRAHYSTFKDSMWTNQGDIAIRIAVEKLLTRGFQKRTLDFTEVAWGNLAPHLARDSDYDLVVIAGGGHLFADPDGKLPPRLTSDIEALKSVRCPIVATSIGANFLLQPGADKSFQFAPSENDKLRQFLNLLSAIAVRDRATQQALAAVGPTTPRIVVDPVFLLPDEVQEPRSVAGDRPLNIGLNIAFHGPGTVATSARSLPLFVSALKRLQRERSCRFYYFVHSEGEHAIAQALRLRGVNVTVVTGNTDKLFKCYRQLDVHIAQMLHSAIFAMSVGVPTLNVAYDMKSVGFFEFFGLEGYCPSVQDIDEATLLASMRKLIAERYEVAEQIRAKRAALQRNSEDFYAAIAALVPHYKTVAAAAPIISSAHFNRTEAMTVSTIIPAYNAEHFIRRALDSALSQSIPNQEVIVVDDGSTDRTREVVATYQDRGVKLISHTQQKGAAGARNTGIRASTGQFVAFLDADDEWLPGKLQRQLDLIFKNPTMTFVSCRAALISGGQDVGDIYRGAAPAMGENAWRSLLTYPCVATPTVLARRSVLTTTGGFNRWMPVGEDQDMWIRLSLMGDVGHIPETLVKVHSTPNSLSKANFRDQASYVLPMVSAYVARAGAKLTPAERRKILGERYSKIGQAAYANGEFVFGVKTLMCAIAYGHQPWRNVLYLVRASGLMRWLKRLLPKRAS
jgi:glycosyltransferase involved in cell wall biosynthesis/polysaccharide pyruvyl transferase WcaK-like protein